MTSLNFTKMHGLGNDFMVVDAINQHFDLKQLDVPLLAHRHLGIGFDQLLIIEPSANADFNCRIINADGSEAEQCGNGLRCVARFIFDNGLSSQHHFTIATQGGVYQANLLPDQQVQIEMGKPIFEPQQIPYITAIMADLYPITLNDNSTLHLNILSMGNPHAVLQVSALDNFAVQDIGQQIAAHPAFPQSTNVGFMQIIDPEHIRLRTFERGAGETHACGSNACAAVVAGIINNKLSKKVKVHLKYGELTIEWPEKTRPLLMTGPAVPIFRGTF